jgi:endonuclease-3
VGSKTANVVMANAFGLPGLGVDTHVHRVTGRLGLSTARYPEGTERDLKALLPPSDWGRTHHLLIFHGRHVCRARKPACEECPVACLCPSRSAGKENFASS